jgi:hypothetical protein
MFELINAVLSKICGARASDALMNSYLYGQQRSVSTDDYLFQAAAQFLDTFGRIPNWTPESTKPE